jgi:hypothetical protein
MLKALDDFQAIENYRLATGHCDHLIYVKVEREYCYVNGENELKFKTRGDNKRDLREALIKFKIDFWECELDTCAHEMSEQLYNQALRKRMLIPLRAIA